MPIGWSLHIGVNYVDAAHYGGWSGPLGGCEADALDMENIAKATGFKTKTLLTEQATAGNITKALSNAANILNSGDIFLITYSGHGGQVPDVSADEDEGKDETWCLFDRELIDDELYTLYSKFKKGVRILVLSDSCHSGTVIKAQNYETFASTARAVDVSKIKAIPPDVARTVYERHKSLYDSLQYISENPKSNVIAASIILISGCQDDQFSKDLGSNGAFTNALKTAWNNGVLANSYRNFCQEIIRELNDPTQVPNYLEEGSVNLEFSAQKPFSI